MLTFNSSLLAMDALGEYTWKSMTVRESPSAKTYLEYAQVDFAAGKSNRELINAISNAKRAMHLRLEDLCLGFGSVDLLGLKNFPSLIGYVQKCGIVAPSILTQMNDLRNDVEHRYDIPTTDDVKTFLGVTTLFLVATDRWIERQPVEADYFQEVSDGGETFVLVRLEFVWERGLVRLHFRKEGEGQGSHTQTVDHKSWSDEYFRYVHFVLSNNY